MENDKKNTEAKLASRYQMRSRREQIIRSYKERR